MLHLLWSFFSISANEINVPLGQPVYFETNKFKPITNPLSKLAKGMQNIGLNLDPRKIANKVIIVELFVHTYIWFSWLLADQRALPY